MTLTEFEKYFIDKIDIGENLTERELRQFIWEVGTEVSREEGENRRWSRSVSVIKEVNGRFFSIDYEEGLTECQENEYYWQPYEVEKHEYEKTITITEWKKKESKVN